MEESRSGTVRSAIPIGLGPVRALLCGLGSFGRSDLGVRKGVLPAVEIISLL